MSNDDKVIPNGDPQETAGPSGSEVIAPTAEVDKGEAMSGPDDGVQFGLRDELAEHFPVESIIVGISVDDGLPTPMDATDNMPFAPKFGPDTVVCIEDARQYVEVFQGEDFEMDAVVDFPEPVQKALFPRTRFRRERSEKDEPPRVVASKDYWPLASKYDDNGSERPRATFSPERVEQRWGAKFVLADGKYMLVRPIRERCEHYKRMVFANDDTTYKPGEFGHQVIYRNCAARRSVGGALMSVKDEAVYACDHRRPQDFVSIEKFLDSTDRKRIEAKVELVPLFNLKEK